MFLCLTCDVDAKAITGGIEINCILLKIMVRTYYTSVNCNLFIIQKHHMCTDTAGNVYKEQNESTFCIYCGAQFIY